MKIIKILILCMLASTAAAQKMADRSAYIKLNFSMPLPQESALPVIEWISPKAVYTNSVQRKMKIEATVSSSIPLKSIMLKIGDEEYQEELLSKPVNFRSEDRNHSIVQDVTLPEGYRYVEIVTESVSGVIVSDKRRIMVGGDTPEKILSSRKDYALIFTTDNYDNFSDLVNPVTDGDSIATLLKKNYGFSTEVVKNASSEAIWEKIREYNEKQFGPYDQLLIFFAGHGTYDEVYKEGYYIASDSRKDDPSGNTYISHIRLAKILDNNPCRRILLIMDSCFGGALGEVGSFTETSSTTKMKTEYELTREEMLARKLSYKVRKYFTSGGKEYVSDGIKGQHSPFASRLITSLKTQGGEDEVLTISEIKVNMETLPQLPRFGEFGHNEMLGDFVFIHSRK